MVLQFFSAVWYTVLATTILCKKLLPAKSREEKRKYKFNVSKYVYLFTEGNGKMRGSWGKAQIWPK